MSRLYSGLDSARAPPRTSVIAAKEIPNTQRGVVAFMASRDFGGRGRRRDKCILSEMRGLVQGVNREADDWAPCARPCVGRLDRMRTQSPRQRTRYGATSLTRS